MALHGEHHANATGQIYKSSIQKSSRKSFMRRPGGHIVQQKDYSPGYTEMGGCRSYHDWCRKMGNRRALRRAFLTLHLGKLFGIEPAFFDRRLDPSHVLLHVVPIQLRSLRICR